MSGSSNRVLLANYLLGQQASTYGKNYVLNTSAFMNLANVVNSGATLSRNTTTPLTAISDFSIGLANNATDTVTWSTGTLDRSANGKNCELRFDYTASSIGTNVVAQILQGSTVISQSLPLPASTTTRGVSINAPCGDGSSATTIVLRNFTGNSGTSSLKVANVTYGLATNVGLSSVITDWQPYVPTYTGLGTVTNNKAEWRRVGSNMQIRAYGTSGTTSAVTATVSLPTGYTTASSSVIQTNNEVTGIFIAAALSSSIASANILSPASSSTLNISLSNGSNFPTNTVVGSNLINNTTNFSWTADVPIREFSGLVQSLDPNVNAFVWSGYHDNTCSWTRTNSAQGDFSTDASCSLVQTQNSNAGTITTVSGTLPGIVFNPSSSGQYEVCAYPLFNAASGASTYITLRENSSTILAEHRSSDASAVRRTATLCGIVGVASAGSSVDIRLWGSSDSGSVVLIDDAPIQGQGTIRWSVKKLTQNMPAPILVGSVTSASTTAERVERTTITNNGTASIASQSGSWLSSVTRNGTGDLTINIASGMFSGTPTCTCNVIQNVALPFIVCTFKTLSSTAVRFQAAVTATGAATDQDMTVICMGPRA